MINYKLTTISKCICKKCLNYQNSKAEGGGPGGMFRSSGGLKSRGFFTQIQKDPDLLPHEPNKEDPKWELTKYFVKLVFDPKFF